MQKASRGLELSMHKSEEASKIMLIQVYYVIAGMSNKQVVVMQQTPKCTKSRIMTIFVFLSIL